MRRCLLVALAICTSVPAFAGSYEMKDLEALEKQESWQEAFDHLGDIPPSKRDKAWDRIAEKSAAAMLGKLDEKDERGRAGYYGVRFEEPRALTMSSAMTQQYPSLKKSKVFQQARIDAALKGYKNTYPFSRHSTSDDPWLDSLKKLVADDAGQTPDLDLRAGKLITGRLVAYIAIPFFKPALQRNASLCKDADVKSSIVSAITSNVWAADGKAMGDRCFNDVKDGLVAEVTKKHADEQKKTVCPYLDAHKAMPAACKEED